jgi:transcriptional regulator with XRE-family HTH domain
MSRRAGATRREVDVDDRVALGRQVRRLRVEADLTMGQLAEAAGVSQSLVSQIERGLAEPSLGTLRRFAVALGTTVGALFVGGDNADEPAPRTVRESQMVVRRGNRKHLRMPGSDVTYELLVPDLSRKLEVIRAQLHPGCRVPQEPSLHAGEETIVCLRGEVVCVQPDEEYVLGAGDAVSWDASRPHWVENRRKRTAEVIAVITPPNF